MKLPSCITSYNSTACAGIVSTSAAPYTSGIYSQASSPTQLPIAETVVAGLSFFNSIVPPNNPCLDYWKQLMCYSFFPGYQHAQLSALCHHSLLPVSIYRVCLSDASIWLLSMAFLAAQFRFHSSPITRCAAQ